MAVEEDFVAHLRARSGITALTRHKIMALGEVPQSRAKPPYIVYSRDVLRNHTVDGYNWTESEWTLHCYGVGYQGTRDLADAVIDAIDTFRGTMGSTFVDSMRVTDVADIYETPQSSQDSGRHRRSMSVEVFHTESTPTLT